VIECTRELVSANEELKRARHEADRANLARNEFLSRYLSDMPGDDVLQRISSDPSTRDVPVAVLSADASSGSQRQLRASGAIAYLTKPLDVAGVLRLIDEVGGGSQANRS
jgi:CheY-like chemotaxis protein